MKKIINIIFLIIVLFAGINLVNAEEQKYEYNGEEYTFDDSHEGLYCGNLPDKFLGLVSGYKGCFKLDKYEFKSPTTEDDLVYYNVGYSWSHIIGDKDVQLRFYTLKSDPALNQDGKWWSSVYMCLSNSAAKTTTAMYTDSLAAKNPKRENPFDLSYCATFSAKGMNKDSLLDICPTLNTELMLLYENGQKYVNTKDTKYSTEYKSQKEKIRGLCSQVSRYASYRDACITACLDMDDILMAADDLYSIDDKAECGFSGRLIAWILNIIKWIKYIIPVAVIVFGSLDFIKATGSEKDDDMKKAQANFVKRLIAAALIFLIPLLIDFILPKFGFKYYSCNLF